MDSFKSVFFKPDPREQKRKCDSLIRQAQRNLDREHRDTQVRLIKSKAEIKNMAKLAQNNPARRQVAIQTVRAQAKMAAQLQGSSNRLETQKAQLNSVQMQVNEQFALKKIEAGLRSSTVVMKKVNALVKVPQLTETMAQLSQELMKAGVIEEMTDDMLANDELMEDETTEPEIDAVIKDALKDENLEKKFFEAEAEAATLPEVPSQIEAETPSTNIDSMKQRLEALKS